MFLTWNDLSGRKTRYFGERSELVKIIDNSYSGGKWWLKNDGGK